MEVATTLVFDLDGLRVVRANVHNAGRGQRGSDVACGCRAKKCPRPLAHRGDVRRLEGTGDDVELEEAVANTGPCRRAKELLRVPEVGRVTGLSRWADSAGDRQFGERQVVLAR